jgi:hypothetical protein
MLFLSFVTLATVPSIDVKILATTLALWSLPGTLATVLGTREAEPVTVD